MNTFKFFGEGPIFTFDGAMAAAIDLSLVGGTDLHTLANAGNAGLAVIHVVEDATFTNLEFNFPVTGSASIAAKTFVAGSEIVGVRKYRLLTGSIIAYHSK